MSEVIKLVPDTVGSAFQIDPKDVLSAACEHNFHTVVVLAQHTSGELYIASNRGEGAMIILMEQAKLEIIGADL